MLMSEIGMGGRYETWRGNIGEHIWLPVFYDDQIDLQRGSANRLRAALVTLYHMREGTPNLVEIKFMFNTCAEGSLS